MQKQNMGLKILNNMVMATVKQSINSVCIFIHYQPKLPVELKKVKDERGIGGND